TMGKFKCKSKQLTLKGIVNGFKGVFVALFKPFDDLSIPMFFSRNHAASAIAYNDSKLTTTVTSKYKIFVGRRLFSPIYQAISTSKRNTALNCSHHHVNRNLWVSCGDRSYSSATPQPDPILNPLRRTHQYLEIPITYYR